MKKQLELEYPERPGYQRRSTSWQAAEEVRPFCKQLQAEVYRAIWDVGPMTADEVAAHLGKDRLSIRPRCTELALLGRLIDSGVRRRNSSGKMAIVWERNPYHSSSEEGEER